MLHLQTDSESPPPAKKTKLTISMEIAKTWKKVTKKHSRMRRERFELAKFLAQPFTGPTLQSWTIQFPASSQRQARPMTGT